MNQTNHQGTDSKSVRPLFSVIITNWNGEEWLSRCISSIQLSARKTGKPFEVIMVDDASDDGSVQLVENKFRRVRIIRLPENIGYAKATNTGVMKARGRIVVLCNNDLAPKELFIPELLKHFSDHQNKQKLFGVSAKTLGWWDGKPNQLCMGATRSGGRVSTCWSNPSESAECTFVQAGAAAYDRKKYLKLGGLNEIFHPGYWEDYDMSWQARKTGWKCLYEPSAIALHHGGGSMTKRFGPSGVHRMRARNHLLFEWMNLTDFRIIVRHGLTLWKQVAKEWLSGNHLPLSTAIQDATLLFRKALSERLSRNRNHTDQDILRTGDRFEPS